MPLSGSEKVAVVSGCVQPGFKLSLSVGTSGLSRWTERSPAPKAKALRPAPNIVSRDGDFEETQKMRKQNYA